MMDFHIKRTGRHCYSTERELKPGESFYSDLVSVDDELQRRDFCEEAWQGPGEESIGWWRSRIPKNEEGRVYWAPREVLISYFESLQANPKAQPTAYVMALLLVRKRILKLVDSTEGPHGKLLEVLYAKENKTWNVPVVELTQEQASTIQGELAEQLFMDQPPE